MLALSQPDWLSILVLGLTGAGKTSLLFRLKTADFPPHSPEDPEIDTFIHGGIHYRALNLDRPGTNWDTYLTWAHAVIFIVDSSIEAAIQRSGKALSRILELIAPGTAFLILANKVDLPSIFPIAELIQKLGLTEIQYEALQELQIFPVSAKTGEGLAQAIDWLSHKLLELFSKRLRIHDVYVYRADSGTHLGHALFSDTNEDPYEVTALYSALNTFAQTGAGFGGGIKSVLVDFPGGKTRKLVKIQKEKLGVLLVCGEGDPVPLVQEVGGTILDIVEKKPEYQKLEILPGDFLSEIEILERIRPFLAEEALNNLRKGGYSPEFKENEPYDPRAPLVNLLQDRLAFLYRHRQS